jgi:hypothetical protein
MINPLILTSVLCRFQILSKCQNKKKSTTGKKANGKSLNQEEADTPDTPEVRVVKNPATKEKTKPKDLDLLTREEPQSAPSSTKAGAERVTAAVIFPKNSRRRKPQRRKPQTRRKSAKQQNIPKWILKKSKRFLNRNPS